MLRKKGFNERQMILTRAWKLWTNEESTFITCVMYLFRLCRDFSYVVQSNKFMKESLQIFSARLIRPRVVRLNQIRFFFVFIQTVLCSDDSKQSDFSRAYKLSKESRLKNFVYCLRQIFHTFYVLASASTMPIREVKFRKTEF